MSRIVQALRSALQISTSSSEDSDPIYQNLRTALSTLNDLLLRLAPFAQPNRPLYTDMLRLIALFLILDAFYGRRWTKTAWRKSAGTHDSADAAVLEDSDALETEDEEEVEAEAGDGDVLLPPDPPDDPVDLYAPDLDPALPQQPQPSQSRNANRVVGKKKARSLALRDRRRAYNEFIRSQAEQVRAADAETAVEREAALAAERQRRAAVEAQIAEKAKRGREWRRQQEAEKLRSQRRTEEDIRIALTEGLCEGKDGIGKRTGMVDLNKLAARIGWEREQIERFVRGEGWLGWKEDEAGRLLVLLTKKGWIVAVDEAAMREVYRRVGASGKAKVKWEELGELLEDVLGQKKRWLSWFHRLWVSE